MGHIDNGMALLSPTYIHTKTTVSGNYAREGNLQKQLDIALHILLCGSTWLYSIYSIDKQNYTYPLSHFTATLKGTCLQC